MTFPRGPAMKNRFMLAPLTNLQSHPDGRLSDDEFKWLTMRAAGGFGVTMAAEDTERARQYFVQHFGQPRRTLLHGQSYGGGVASKAAELYA
eukprot:gene57610-76899_t